MTVAIRELPCDPRIANFFIESQASHVCERHDEWDGQEPDGQWWNPHSVFGIPDRSPVDDRFLLLFHGFNPSLPTSPQQSPPSFELFPEETTPDRSGAFAITLTADKSVSTLWAMTHSEEPKLHEALATAHDDAVRTALDLAILQYCSWGRRTGNNGTEVLPGKILGATFLHQASQAGNPHLHTHCLIFNLAEVGDHDWVPLHPEPLHEWLQVTASFYRSAMAWDITRKMGLAIEKYGPDDALIRIPGLPQDLIDHWTDPPHHRDLPF